MNERWWRCGAKLRRIGVFVVSREEEVELLSEKGCVNA
jgi:hypothetical protein